MKNKKARPDHGKKFLIISGLLTFLIIATGLFLITKNDKKSTLPDPTFYEYYWSQNCSHCEKVSDFFDTWKGIGQLDIEKYDIDTYPTNRERLIQRGTYCNYPRTELGVPFLVTPDGVCLSGDKQIINFFKSLVPFDQ